MSEKLITRINRLISGTIYDGTEAIEAKMPETVMRESIREIERTISDVRDELATARREQQVAARRIQLTKDKIATFGEKIKAALKSERADLAEAAVSRQLDLEAQIPVLEKSRETSADQAVELESYISALQGRKAEMEAELDSFSELKRDLGAVSTEGDLGGHNCAHEKRAETARNAFDRVMKNATGVAGTSPANRETAAKMIELEAIQRKDQIAARLAVYQQETQPAPAA